ncbi:hypothetical protein HUJ04_008275 [Dendroctonus ponderosae]|nr:hypothetical protein HUJ04_008275 [Dendroctonus ponderosae]KAH1008144.1 hypothetical protein HUJ05_008725 [Dendroctonus ponderosae]
MNQKDDVALEHKPEPNVVDVFGSSFAQPATTTKEPIFIKPRTVPYTLLDKVAQQLDHLGNLGVIEKDVHSAWATPVVPIIRIRLCAAYNITINKYIQDD